MQEEQELTEYEFQVLEAIARAEATLSLLCGTDDGIVILRDEPDDDVVLIDGRQPRLEFRNGELRVFDNRSNPFNDSVALRDLPLPLQLKYGILIPGFIEQALTGENNFSSLVDAFCEMVVWGFSGASNVSLVVQGTITGDKPNQPITINATNWINNGALSSSPSGILVAIGSWTNSGTVTAGGGTLALGGTWSSTTGTFSANSGTLSVGGTGT